MLRLGTYGPPRALAAAWDGNYLSACYAAWGDRATSDAWRVAAHMTTILRSYLRADQQAYTVRGYWYELLQPDCAEPMWRGVIHPAFDPWSTRS